MKKPRLTTIFSMILIFAGISLALYPTISNILAQKHASQAITEYNDEIKDMDEEKIDAVKEAMQQYNEQLGNAVTQVLAYEVDQIKVVDPEDTSDLDIVEGKDYVTLVTCTPYAVNTHRLLVRGHRVPYTGEEKAKTVSQVRPAAMAQRVVDVWPWFLFMMAGVAVTEGVIILLILIKRHHDKKKKG